MCFFRGRSRSLQWKKAAQLQIASWQNTNHRRASVPFLQLPGWAYVWLPMWHAGVERAYGSYEDLAKDPDVDLVYIANLHPQHKDTVMTMTKYKKNILCEKPLSVNKKETQAMIDAAKEADVFFMAGLWSRFFPAQKLWVTVHLSSGFVLMSFIIVVAMRRSRVPDSTWWEKIYQSLVDVNHMSVP